MISDLATEGIVIGFIYRYPELLDEYIDLIVPKYDFTDENCIFLYEIIINAYISNGKLDHISINLYISSLDNDKIKKWQEIKGFDILDKLVEFSKSVDKFETVYKKLKVYNVFRYLKKQGFSIEQDLDRLKDKDADYIVKYYENKLVKSANYIRNINDSELIGKDMLKVYEKYKEEPSVGIEIPFPIIDSITRGWRLNTVYAHAMHSGYGKSRLAVNIMSYISMVYKVPVLLCVNEQDKEEIELMLLTSIANNLFRKKYGLKINESDIALGRLKGDADRMLYDAAKFIQENTNLHIYEMQNWDLNSIKMILKRNKLKGIDYAVVDTFKAMRGLNMHMSDWQQFVYTAEKLKEIVGSEKKGGLNMGLWLTLQMTDDSLLTQIMNSTALATGKQVKHHLDYLMMFRPITAKEKETMKVKINMPNNSFNGSIQSLDLKQEYYLGVVDKNRGGRDKQKIIYKVDKGAMIFEEMGYMTII